MAYNNGGLPFDEKAILKSKSQKDLISLRNQFNNVCANSRNNQFHSYLSLIELEIASRIGKKSKQHYILVDGQVFRRYNQYIAENNQELLNGNYS